MVSEILITDLAKQMLDDYIAYLAFVKNSHQAARAVYQDAKETAQRLLLVAESLHYCADEDLRKMGYRYIQFKRHRYLYIYRVIGNVVSVDAVYHESQEAERLFKQSL